MPDYSRRILFEALSPILKLSRFFCLSPIEIEFINNKIVFKCSKANWFYKLRLCTYSIVIIVTTLLAQLVDFSFPKQQKSNNNETVSKNVYMNDRIINTLVSAASVNSSVLSVLVFNIGHLFDHSKFVNCLNTLANFEIKNYRIDYKSCKLYSRIMFFNLFLKTLIKIILVLYTYWSENFLIVFIAFFSVHVPLLFIIFTSIQWMSIMLLVAKYLQDIENYLEINLMSNCPDLNFNELIEFIKEVYDRFCFISMEINREYSFKIFFLISLLFMLVTTHGFYFFQTFVSHHVIAAIPIVNLIIYSVQITTFVIPCVLVESESKKLVDIVANFPEEYSSQVSIFN